METKNTPCHSRENGNPAETCVCHRTDIHEAGAPRSRGWQKQIAWFTLVELIVVITILVILGTIAFLNLGGYSGSARDSSRVSDMTNIAQGLELALVRNGTVPVPEAGSITVSASGVVIGYQGYAGGSVLSAIKMSEAKDPLDKKYYTYSTNVAYTKYEMLGLMEDPGTLTSADVPFVSTAYAGYETRTPATKGSALGILLGNTGASLNVPVQENYNAGSFTGVDVMTTSTGYTAYFSSKNSISGTGTRLMSLKASYTQKSDPLVYDSSLVWYWDMETLTPDGKLADLSGNGNSGSGAGGIVLGGVDGNGRSGKATSFDGTNDYIDLGTFDPSSGDMTLSFWLYKDSYNSNTEEIIWKRDGWSADLSDHRWAFYIRNSNKVLSYWRNGFEVNTTNSAKLWSWNNYVFSYVSWTGNVSKWYENWILIWSWPWYLFWNKTNAGVALWRAGSQNGEYLLWKLDEVRIYNRALSDSEIQALYQATR